MFYKKTVNNFLNSEQKKFTQKKERANFLDNAKQKII